MALFDFKNYGTEGETPVQDSDIVFHATHSYADPSNSDETRRQLSTPLFQLKKFINSLFDANGKMIPSNLPVASESAAGTMSATDKAKLNGIANGAQVNVVETVKLNGTAITPSEKAVNIEAVPNTRTINGKALSSDISLDADDVGAASLPDPTYLEEGTVMVVYADYYGVKHWTAMHLWSAAVDRIKPEPLPPE